MSKKSAKYKGITDRGTAGKARLYARVSLPGKGQVSISLDTGDWEIAKMKLYRIKQEAEAQAKYGVQGWTVFKEQYIKENATKNAKTLKLDEWSLAKFEEVIHPQSLVDMTPRNLIIAQTVWAGKYKLSLNTLDTWRDRIITIAHWAEDMEIKPMANWRIVKKLSKSRGRKDIYTDAQFLAIEAQFPKFTKEYTAVMLAAEAGLRRSEVFYVWFEDIDLETRIGEVKGRDGWTPKMESDDRRRYFVITPRLRDYLVELKKFSKSKYVYADPNTGFRPYSPEAITRRLVRLSHKKGFEGVRVSFHKFRHTYVTRLMDSGKELASVRNAARHKSSATTELYDHTGAKKALMAVDRDVFPAHD